MADFGARLREARERKGISLRQIAAATKISVAALEGLERNDISRLPGGIFTRAFVRSYAIEVGLDPDETVKDFLQQFSSEPSLGPAPVVAPTISPAPQRAVAPRGTAPPRELGDEVDFESKQRMAGVVLKLVLVSLPIAVIIVYLSSRQPAGQPGQVSVETAGEAVSTEPAAEAPARPEESAVAPASAAPTPPAPAAETPAAPPVTAPAPESTPVPAGEELVLELAPTGDCWAKITVDGTVALSRVVTLGERERLLFRDVAVVQVGDAAACTLAINGRPLKPLGAARQVREIEITRGNYETFLR